MSEAGQRRVLVVNDDRRLAESVCELLGELNCETRLALDGEQGFQAMFDWRPDLILLDIMMPRLDGWGFLERLGTLAPNERPAVLVWSVLTPDDLERARALGATDCLPRGATSPDQLLEIVARALGGSPTR